MPPDHHPCGDEGHNHDHEHDLSLELGPQDNLFSQVDLQNVTVLNAAEEGSIVIKPWDRRLDETKSIVSAADDQLILRVPFISSVKLRAILLKTGPGDQTPSKVLLFATADSLDFEDVEARDAAQELIVAQGRDVGEYAVKASKFSNLSAITLFFPESQGADSVQIFYVGFLGHWTQTNKEAVVTVYEAQANPADHEKIQGTERSFSNPQV